MKDVPDWEVSALLLEDSYQTAFTDSWHHWMTSRGYRTGRKEGLQHFPVHPAQHCGPVKAYKQILFRSCPTAHRVQHDARSLWAKVKSPLAGHAAFLYPSG